MKRFLGGRFGQDSGGQDSGQRFNASFLGNKKNFLGSKKNFLGRLTLKVSTLGVISLATCTLALAGCEPPEQEFGVGSYPQTGRLGISADGSTLYVALTDHDKVQAIDAATGERLGETAVFGSPNRLTVMNDGRIAVTARRAGTVNVLDAQVSEVQHSVEVGSDPHGVIETDGKLVVAVTGQAELARLSLDDLDRVQDRVALDIADPRGLAVGRDGTVFVSHFKSPTLSTVDMATGTPSDSITLAMASNPFFKANQVDSLTVSPDKGELVVPHQECNNDPSQFAAGGTDLGGGATTMAYYASGPTGYPAVIPAVSRIDTDAKLNLSNGPGPYDQAFPQGKPAPAGPAPATISPTETERIGSNIINLPVAAALADDGRIELLVNKGSGNVFVRRSTLGPGDRALIAVVDTGVGSSDIVLSPDGRIAYVYNEFDYTITSFEIPEVETTTTSEGSSLAQFSSDGTWRPDARPVRNLEPTGVFSAADSILPSEVEEGRVLFHSVTPNLTMGGAVSCASCHAGGGADDGTTWSFDVGPRQTPPLWGGISETTPLHWDNTFDEGFDDINRLTVQLRMGGEGLSNQELGQLVSYLDTLEPPAPPMNADEDSVDRGREIFFSDETGCKSCHSGAHFTDNQAYDVGTGRGAVDGETLDSFATPPLHGLAHTAPYLHSGTAPTLRALIDDTVVTDQMGRGSHLTEQDKDDLAAFLKTL